VELNRGFKKTEIGTVPNDWNVSSLKEVSTQISDGTHFTPRYVSSGVPFYSVENITANDFVNTKYITKEEHQQLVKRCRPERGDILMTRITAGILGDTKLIDWDVDASIYVSLALIKIKKTFNSEYIYRYTKSPAFRREIEKRGLINATPKKINMNEIGAVPVPLPTSSIEQEAIANALSDTDIYIESLEKLIAKKYLIKKGVMRELLTGKRRLEDFKGKWKVKSFGELFQFSGGYSASRDDLSDEGHPYLHYGDIHKSNKTYIDLTKEAHVIPKLNIPLSEASISSVLRQGDVVFVDASEDDEGTSKHVVVYNPDRKPFISGLHTIVAKARTDELDVDYCRFCFQTDEVKKQFKFYAVGTKVSGVSKTNIAKINLTFPSKDEQSAIANFLIDIELEQEALAAKLQKARLLKQNMMQKLLTGRIRLV
jgi:type I restriction enzyme, S subunit